jgi:hypothetical protein
MNKYYLVGEMHGTRECPKEFLNFIKKKHIKKVALEFPKEYQKEIDEFSLGKKEIENLSIFRNREKIHDGRASEAIKDLIKKLKKEKIKIFLVDEEAKNGNERDKKMAKNLSKIEGEVAFLCGNIHAMKKPMTLDKSDPMYKYYQNGIVKTCRYFMNKKEIISIRIHAINGGKFYNFATQDYPKEKEFKNKKPSTIKSKDEAFDYIYLIDKFSPSK